MSERKYLFGPIRSRRLGLSLGVDLIPMKTCSFDCVYCECGKTTQLTTERSKFFSFTELIKELDAFFSEKRSVDYVTFAGSGEPTLYRRLGETIKYLKSRVPKQNIALITNGSLFCNPDIRNEILEVDLVLPSLDAASQEVFEKINRPARGLKITEIITGLQAWNRITTGQMWLEFFVVPGINDTNEELSALKRAFTKIEPTLVQLNGLDRPGTEDWVKPPSKERLSEIKDFLSPLKVEIIKFNKISKHSNELNEEEVRGRVLETIRRRPSTLVDLVSLTNLKEEQILRCLKKDLELGTIQLKKMTRGEFFSIKSTTS